MTVGFIIFAILMIASYKISSASFNYDTFVMSEQMREVAAVILTLCFSGAIAFKMLIKKEKSSDRDFEQKE
ncbi:MAG: hypothetical protein WCX81_01770 [Monoglobales bacterium]